MSQESEGAHELEQSLMESAEPSILEEIMDTDDIVRMLEQGKIEEVLALLRIEAFKARHLMEGSIRAEIMLAEEHANDPHNWDLAEVNTRLFTIDLFLKDKDKLKDYDPRCIALAKTNLQQAMMWLNKAYFQGGANSPRTAKRSIDDSDQEGKEVKHDTEGQTPST